MARLLAFAAPPGAAAGELIAEFSSLAAVLAASPEALARLASPVEVELLGAVRAVCLLALRREAARGPILSTSESVVDYLRALIGHATVETAHILYVDTRNCLIRDETVAIGTIDQAFFSPREILRRALELNAAGIVVTHNHPSGDPTPSLADREATRRLAAATRQLDIRLLDHVIVAREKWTSFSLEGWL